MDKINPAAYITDTDPVDQAVLPTWYWYNNQFVAIYDKEQIPWVLAQGWTPNGSSGSWVTEVGDDGVTRSRYVTNTWHFTRQVLNPAAALSSLVTSFTDAYNEGRQLNDQRYDEIVAMFTVMLDKAENHANTQETADTAYDSLIQTLLSSIGSDYTSHETDVDGALDDWGDSERERITTQFDNQVAAARASAIARGIYNTTVWDSINAGIERERATANTDLEDKIMERQVTLKDRLYTLKTDMRSKVLASRDRVRNAIHARDMQRLGMRNDVLKALLSFMERREDGYPDLGQMANLTAQLGAGQPNAYPTA